MNKIYLLNVKNQQSFIFTRNVFMFSIEWHIFFIEYQPFAQEATRANPNDMKKSNSEHISISHSRSNSKS